MFQQFRPQDIPMNHAPGPTATTRGLGILGVAGPLLFTFAWILAAFLDRGYSPRREDISGLAALDAAHPWIVIAGFVALGFGTAALAAGIHRSLARRRSATIGSLLVAAAGLGILAAGGLRNDCSTQLEACARREVAGTVSWHHVAHDLVSVLVFVLLIVAPLVLARAFRGDAGWARSRRYSFVTASATAVLLVVFGSGAATGWNGLVQRIFVSVPFLWIAVLGWRVAAPGDDALPAHARARSGRSRKEQSRAALAQE